VPEPRPDGERSGEGGAADFLAELARQDLDQGALGAVQLGRITRGLGDGSATPLAAAGAFTSAWKCNGYRLWCSAENEELVPGIDPWIFTGMQEN
jgi:hypothetical protein